MKTTSNTNAPQNYRVGIYKLFGFNGLAGIAEAPIFEPNGQKAARIYRGPQGYQAETLAGSFATEWHLSEMAAIFALFYYWDTNK